MPRGSDDSLARQSLLELIIAVETLAGIMIPNSSFSTVRSGEFQEHMNRARELALRIDRVRGKKVTGGEEEG